MQTIGKKITLAHVISAQDPQSFYNLKEKFCKEYGDKIKVSCMSITPVLAGSQNVGGQMAAQLVIIPAIYYELEFNEEEAKQFRLHQSLILKA